MSLDLIPPTNEKAPRKFPAPCWAQDETLILISSYRDRWYALRRGYLRSADWDAVAAEIAEKYAVVPAKTAAQCRHKIEKLRQRYRAEKQRRLSLAYTQFPSSWFFFESMDLMENGGSISAVGSIEGNQANDSNGNNNYSSVLLIKSIGDRSLVDPVIKTKISKTGFQPNPVSLGFKGNFSAKIEGNYRNPNAGLAYLVDGDDVDKPDFGSGVGFRMPFEEKIVTPIIKAKKLGKIRGDYSANYSASHYYPDGKMNTNPNLFYSDVNPRAKDSVRCEMNTNVLSGGGKGMKRDREPIDEIVSSIRCLGEGFLRMEKMKMDMAWEMEKTRMEMELKRNELILESQRRIVDAFKSIFSENNSNNDQKNKKTVTTTLVLES